MSFYVIKDPNEGRIVQGNKIYFPDEQYEKAASDLGQQYIRVHDTKILSPDDYYAPADEVKERPNMQITLDGATIPVGEKGAAIFRGLPSPVGWHLNCMGMEVHRDSATKNVLEVSVPVPGLYEVVFEQFPYKTSRFTFEAK